MFHQTPELIITKPVFDEEPEKIIAKPMLEDIRLLTQFYYSGKNK